MKDPLIVRNGLMQSAGRTRLRLPRVNVGQSERINVTGPAVTIYRTLHHLASVNRQDVYFIDGGQDGDILLLTGENVRLVPGGNININGNLPLITTIARFFVLISGEWTRVL